MLTLAFLLDVFLGDFSAFSRPATVDFSPRSLILSFGNWSCLLLPAGRHFRRASVLPFFLLGLSLISFLPRKEVGIAFFLPVSWGSGSIQSHRIWLSDSLVDWCSFSRGGRKFFWAAKCQWLCVSAIVFSWRERKQLPPYSTTWYINGCPSRVRSGIEKCIYLAFPISRPLRKLA